MKLEEKVGDVVSSVILNLKVVMLLYCCHNVVMMSRCLLSALVKEQRRRSVGFGLVWNSLSNLSTKRLGKKGWLGASARALCHRPDGRVRGLLSSKTTYSY